MEKLNKETIKRISNSPGIYYIKNIVNGKGYIGKSSGIDSITGIWKDFKK